MQTISLHFVRTTMIQVFVVTFGGLQFPSVLLCLCQNRLDRSNDLLLNAPILLKAQQPLALICVRVVELGVSFGALRPPSCIGEFGPVGLWNGVEEFLPDVLSVVEDDT